MPGVFPVGYITMNPRENKHGEGVLGHEIAPKIERPANLAAVPTKLKISRKKQNLLQT